MSDPKDYDRPRVRSNEPDERRWFPRHDLTLPIVARAPGHDGALPLELRGLSLDGAFVRSDLLLEVGDEVDLELPLPAPDHDDASSTVRARAEVVRVAVAAGGMGLRLSRMSAGDRRALLRFLSVAR